MLEPNGPHRTRAADRLCAQGFRAALTAQDGGLQYGRPAGIGPIACDQEISKRTLRQGPVLLRARSHVEDGSFLPVTAGSQHLRRL